MCETAARNLNLFWLQVNVLVDFAALTVEACSG
jgi:hypothetical protein